jgi:hypothetical protein
MISQFCFGVALTFLVINGACSTTSEVEKSPTVARDAHALAVNPNSRNAALSEVSIPGLTATNIYLQDRFFTDINFLQQQTVFIHELNRNNGYMGTDKADYANIIKACSTYDPYK